VHGSSFALPGDGQHWVQFDEAYQIGIEPVYAQGKMAPQLLKDLKGERVAQEDAKAPVVYRTELLAPKPNPFNPRVEIAYTLERTGQVDITIYDVRGRAVATLVDESRPAGPNSVIWEGTDDRGGSVASGVYFVRFVAQGVTSQKRIALIR